MIALISEIHGNYTALIEVLNKIDELGVKEIYCLGDNVGYYSQINECCDELRKRGIQSVMGNHDWYLASGGFCPRSKSVNDCLAFQRKIISRENLDWVSRLPSFLRVGDLTLVHGGWTNPIDEYFEPSENYFLRVEGKYFASGHTHKQLLKIFGNKIYCNPGSVGQPRDGDSRAAFALFDGKQFMLHRVKYDIDKVCMLMEDVGFSRYYYDCLRIGAEKLGYIS